MTQYLTLINPVEPNTKINISFGADCGVWIEHPTEKSKMLARMIVHETQENMRHNRKRMSKYFNWERVINKYTKMYNLEKIETET